MIAKKKTAKKKAATKSRREINVQNFRSVDGKAGTRNLFVG